MSVSLPNWFRTRRYLHFDSPVGVKLASALVTSPKAVSQHAFYPLISYEITTRKVKKDSYGKIIPNDKNRPIAYPAHLDSHIYSYYARQLSEAYELALHKRGISDAVLAFRPLGKSNIHFAAEAFQTIRSRGNCTAIGLDISGFFDNLDHNLLKKAWCQILDLDKLPDDHFAVFKAITRYSVVDRSEVYGLFGISEHNPKAPGRRICSAADFRLKVRSKGLIKVHDKNYGIPQGTPISAILSNIYMLEFDKKMVELVSPKDGKYVRYCDDMLVIIPRHSYRRIESKSQKFIEELKLKINPDKTEICRFALKRGKLRSNRLLPYLGFTFDGQNVLLRSAALARYSQRMKSGVRLAAATAKSKNDQRVAQGRPIKALYKRKLYERYSHLGGRNFVRYGFRAAQFMLSKSIRKQLKPLWPRLKEEIDDVMKGYTNHPGRRG